MPRGAPDDSNVRVEGMIVRIEDIGEWFRRLIPGVVYYRSGNLVFRDCFDSGLAAWYLGIHDADGFIRLTTDYYPSDGLAAGLCAGIGFGLEVNMILTLPFVKSSRVGLHVREFAELTTEYIEHTLQQNDNDWSNSFVVRVHTNPVKITYKDKNGDFQDVPGQPTFPTLYEDFYHVKLVGDYEKHEYVAIYLNEFYMPMTGIGCLYVKNVPPSNTYIDLRVHTMFSGGVIDAVFDSITVTQNDL